MTYPQPNSNNYLTGGYPFFRLNTQLVSPGDIYESEVGATAFAIGPESDIANARIFYFDNQLTPTLMNEIVVSPDRAMVGTIFAANDLGYLPANRPGRILIAADDIYDPTYIPSTATEGDPIEFVAPVLDVIQYFSPQASLASHRADRRYYFQMIVPAQGSVNTSFLVLPFYGRKYAAIYVTNLNPTDTFTLTLFGVNFLINDAGFSGVPAQEVETLAPQAILPRKTFAALGDAVSPGMYDAIVISVANLSGSADGHAAVIRATFSDEE